MRSLRVPRLPRPGQSWPSGRRYLVRVPGEYHGDIKTVADLKAWRPATHVPEVEVCGWVRSVRKSSGVRFIDITDGSSMRPVQVVVDKKLATDMRPGAAVRLRGTWRTDSQQQRAEAEATSQDETAISSTRDDSAELAARRAALSAEVSSVDAFYPLNSAVEQNQDTLKAKSGPNTHITTAELQVTEVEILGLSDPQTYPIQNKYQTPESLRTITHLRSRTPLNSTLLRFRSDATALLTQFFFREKFQQAHPPIITSSDCEGAGEAFAVKAGGPAEFFRDPKFLTVSSQLHLESLAQALGNVWTLSPTFRAEQSDTSRHLSEFYMLEAEMSFVQNMDEVMDLAQKMLTTLVKELKQLNAATELETNRLDSKDPTERLAYEDLVDQAQLGRRWRGMLVPGRWPRITYTQAIDILKPVADRFEHPPVWGAGLHSEHERYLAEELGFDEATDASVPVFITQYPRGIKAFYMLQSAASPSQGPTVDCFDLLVPSVGELAGGSMREHRLPQLEQNMRTHGLQVPTKKSAKGDDLAWYVDLRRWGCPPHGGFGLGFDRLLSYLTGVPNVRDVVAFPRHFERESIAAESEIGLYLKAELSLDWEIWITRQDDGVLDRPDGITLRPRIVSVPGPREQAVNGGGKRGRFFHARRTPVCTVASVGGWDKHIIWRRKLALDAIIAQRHDPEADADAAVWGFEASPPNPPWTDRFEAPQADTEVLLSAHSCGEDLGEPISRVYIPSLPANAILDLTWEMPTYPATRSKKSPLPLLSVEYLLNDQLRSSRSSRAARLWRQTLAITASRQSLDTITRILKPWQPWKGLKGRCSTQYSAQRIISAAILTIWLHQSETKAGPPDTANTSGNKPQDRLETDPSSPPLEAKSVATASRKSMMAHLLLRLHDLSKPRAQQAPSDQLTRCPPTS
ncbi:hypothetical protein G7046_g8521 [Stylonectria norvegica]|nr:hypothetical protein G7046_g8521 [Stylonectria norvegica]